MPSEQGKAQGAERLRSDAQRNKDEILAAAVLAFSKEPAKPRECFATTSPSTTF
jgi:hypothetical protein